jgi:hypothetical protein
MGRPAKNPDGLILEDYNQLLKRKNSKVHSTQLFTYTSRYHEVYASLSFLETIPASVRNNALKSFGCSIKVSIIRQQ